jgi:general secretion pathway protein A
VYLEHFHLTEEPFSVTSDPRFLYLSQSHDEALAHLDYCIKFRKGFAAITGEIGTGKTTLLNTLISRLDEHYSVAFVYRSAATTEELMRYVFKDLGLPTDLADRASYLNRFNDYLLEQAQAGRDVVLVIDEGQNLPSSVLEDLRLISNFETPTTKLVQIILAGQTELAEKLQSPELRQLSQRISIQYKLKALNPDETGSYIQHRLKTANARQLDIFQAKAVKRIYQASGGVPRVINQICDTALVRAAYLRKSVVDVSVVNAVLREDFQFRVLPGTPTQASEPTPIQRWAVRAALGLAVIVVAGATGWWLGRQPVADGSGVRARVLADDGARAELSNGAEPTEPRRQASEQQAYPANAAGLSPQNVAERDARSQAIVSPASPVAVTRSDKTLATKPEAATATLPGEDANTTRVRVKAGDSMVELARRHYGFSTWELLNLLQRQNQQIENPNRILVGDWIVMPVLSDSAVSRLKAGQPF